MPERNDRETGESNRRQLQGLPVIRRNVAGVDLGSERHWVCAPTQDGNGREIASFGATTRELLRLGEWLKARQVESVAMESTGVYWIAPHEVLEGQGLQVLLVDTRQLARVPGRDKKTDPSDCEWMQRLHSCGLLRGSFRPEEAVCRLRTLVRDKANLADLCSDSFPSTSDRRTVWHASELRCWGILAQRLRSAPLPVHTCRLRRDGRLHSQFALRRHLDSQRGVRPDLSGWDEPDPEGSPPSN